MKTLTAAEIRQAIASRPELRAAAADEIAKQELEAERHRFGWGTVNGRLANYCGPLERASLAKHYEKHY